MSEAINNYRPLADRMRPRDFADFAGQKHLVAEGKLLRQMIERDSLLSMIFWGPPGTGKTTLAKIIAHKTGANFLSLSAVMSGKDELRRALAEAEQVVITKKQKTVLFIDEIHRWNKAQQDALLPHVEKGSLILIGATTENPSFEIIGALLSRCRVFVLKELDTFDIARVIKRALTNEAMGLGGQKIDIDEETIFFLAELAGGDARAALNALELALEVRVDKEKMKIDKKVIKEALQRVHLKFDKKGEEFYNLISALHKSMRGSDVNAALYWLARMFEGGADPLYIARRVLRFASEDIGMANGEAMIQANTAYDACYKIGYPECSVHLAQAVVYCAKAKKSNLLYRAYNQAAEDARHTSHLGVPLHLCNAPTKLMKELNYGKGYKYNPDYDGPVEQDYLPEELKGRKYL
jgi:putative ATPase